MRQPIRFALILAAGVAFGASAAYADETIASRGDVKVTLDELREVLGRQEQQIKDQILGNPQAMRDFVQDRLMRKILMKELQAEKFESKPDVVVRATEAKDASVVQSWLAAQVKNDPAFPSEAELQAAYDANKARFTVPTQYHVAQIAILVPPGSTKEADAEALKKIRDLRAQAVKPKADFAELARKNSGDKNSADKGGDLGWVREDQIVGGVKEAVKGLAEGAVSEPVRSNDAWHIVKMLGSKPPSLIPLDQVRQGLTQALRGNRAQEQVKAYMQGLLSKQGLEINDAGLADKMRAAK